jgi:hypothetical protein
VTHQNYRLGVIKKLINDVEIGDNITKEEIVQPPQNQTEL